MSKQGVVTVDVSVDMGTIPTPKLDQKTLDDRLIAKALLAGIVFESMSIHAMEPKGLVRCVLPDGYVCGWWFQMGAAARDAIYAWEARCGK